MNASLNFKKSFEAVESLMNLQMGTINKSIELQKKSSDELANFFKGEAEKAQKLTTPDEVMAFNIESSKALFELLKSQGDAFTAVATEARVAATEELSKLTA
ncbi:hypothetical protein GCM10011348_41970 [Marinobacterium nitratireducens]|uniref:DNA phosphorothioation-dependent restriction protein DptG n=1 Tax=Marinobacterium nitratireducens TaxID=518897 RepID=A0A918DWN2_9GAMM|nr:hypothetical protein [Marinobacterium nitratireducens]GGO87846.1 hypothetical protein GCM10011348_41970 [Marinobacterium nitratireducens]